MNNAKTRFVIAISQKLSSAPESDAKVDMIEELSENLYGRFQDMVAAGMPESEAFSTALDKLGDVNELLAYLDRCGKTGSFGDDTQRQGAAAAADPADDWFRGIGSFVRQTISQAQDSINDAAAMVQNWKDFQQKFDNVQINVKDGETVNVNMGGARVPLRTDDEEDLELPSAGLREIKVNIMGDLSVYLDGDPDSPVWLRGDIDDIQAATTEDGVLTVTQGKSASGSFLFARFLSSASIELTIPRRRWEKLDITTVNGDVELSDGPLEADTVRLKTTSGDMQLDGLKARRLEVDTASGDLILSGCACDELVFRSASGDLQGEEVTAAVLATTASGDVSLSGNIRALKADTASGDVELDTELFPEALELSTKSGDCTVNIPDNNGFILRFATVSGSLHSKFSLTTAAGARQGRGGRSGEAYYRDGGDGRVFAISSVSGDIQLGEK